MTADDFLRSLQKSVAPVYLFIGPENFDRERCRKALIEKALPAEDRVEGLTRYDLDETDLDVVLDDAQSLSLFASNRLIWASSAEGALPRGRAVAAASDDEEDGAPSTAIGRLSGYIKDPSPGITLVFDCSRYEFEGDDKAKIQRVQKFYSAIPIQVELQPYSPAAARKLINEEARRLGLKIGESQIEMLIEVLGADASRILTELEKLALFLGGSRAVSENDIINLVPNARASTIFSLVAALGRHDRTASLDSLDVLVREGEYLPMALTFLGTQFRLALVAKEAGLNNAGQIMGHFSKIGTPMWRSRAEQVEQTVRSFSKENLRQAISKIYEADKALRDTRPDDRTVMEHLVLTLT